MYSGFELCEATPLPGSEEYLDFGEIRDPRLGLDRPGNIVEEITRLNMIRRSNPALQTHLRHRASTTPSTTRSLATARRPRTAATWCSCAVSLDPHNAQEAAFEVPLWECGCRTTRRSRRRT